MANNDQEKENKVDPDKDVLYETESKYYETSYRDMDTHNNYALNKEELLPPLMEVSD